MKIILTEKYKSLYPFESDELSDFCVVTGKNGSGKSQLISIMSSEPQTNIGIEISYSDGIKATEVYVNKMENTLSLRGTYTDYRPAKQAESLFRSYELLGPNTKSLILALVDQGVEFSNFAEKFHSELGDRPIFNLLFSTKGDIQKLINDAAAELGYKTLHTKAGTAVTTDVHCKKWFFWLASKGEWDLYKSMIDFGKDFINLSIVDFKGFVWHKNSMEVGVFASHGIDGIFTNYLLRRFHNENLYFWKNNRDHYNNAVSDEEFVKSNPEPWIELNRWLEKLNMPFKIKEIDYLQYDPDYYYKFEFLHKGLNEVINIGELSSGEKVIMTLIFFFFNVTYRNGCVNYPKVMVIDEPDAHLHPEMTDLLIKLLNDIFVKEYGIKVIITTHSPSTVALAPDDSIFQLKNGNPTSLKKISKDDALKILTGNLPNLSIDYKSHRQVFVESPTDLEYYQAVFNKLNEKNKFQNPLYFISLGYGKGNCDQVRNLVNSLRNSGNTTCYGLIDKDKGNISDGLVFVHGENELWSIENYLYIPLFLAGLFIKEKGAQGICQELGFSETFNEYSLGEETEARLQEVSDWIINQILEKKIILKSKIKMDDVIEIILLNDKRIKIPRWFADTKGHEIETILKEVFPALQKFRNEGELQKEITKFIVKSYSIIPKTTVDLIYKLGGYDG